MPVFLRGAEDLKSGPYLRSYFPKSLSLYSLSLQEEGSLEDAHIPFPGTSAELSRPLMAPPPCPLFLEVQEEVH